MAIVSGARHTSADLGLTIREDLSDVISMISPYDTPFFSMIGTVAATSTKHEWLRDSLASADSGGALEGDGFSGTAPTTPTRASNYSQILRKDFSVTGTNEAVTHAGMASQFSYQMMKALRELARNTEQALLCQDIASNVDGDAETARTMKGLYHQILDADVAVTADNFVFDVVGTGDPVIEGTGAPANTGTAVALTESDFNTLLQRMWEAGVAPDTVLASPAAKRDITAFSGSSIARFNVDKNELVKNVMRYESDFGTVDVMLERFGPVGGGSSPTADTNQIAAISGSNSAFAFERQHINKAILRPTVAERLPRSGDSERGMILHELTLQVGAIGAAGAWVNIAD